VRIVSTQEGSYTAVGPEYPIGLIPALASRCFAVFGLIFSNSPISLTLSPFILILSAPCKNNKEFVEKVQQVIDNMLQMCYSFLQGDTNMEPKFGTPYIGDMDYTGVDIRIGHKEDAIALLDELLTADSVRCLDVPLKALRDAIERGIL
jgi:hypothetical protein